MHDSYASHPCALTRDPPHDLEHVLIRISAIWCYSKGGSQPALRSPPLREPISRTTPEAIKYNKSNGLMHTDLTATLRTFDHVPVWHGHVAEYVMV